MSLLDAASSFINNAVNTAAQARANKKNIEFQRETNQQNIDFQREINDTNYQRQLDMWNMTNEYNHPAQQMQRYKDAGLNPNLIYGQSNTAQSANVGTAQATKVDAPSVSPELRQAVTFGNIGLDFFNLMQRKEEVESLQLDNEFKRKTIDSNINIVKEKARQMAYDTTYKDLMNKSLSIDNAIKEIEKEIKEVTKDNEIEKSDLSVDKAKKENSKLDKEISLIEANAKLAAAEEALKKSQVDLSEEQKKVYQEQVNKLKAEISDIQQSMGISLEEHKLDRLQQLLEMYMNANKSWQFEGGLYLQKEFKNLLKEIFPNNDYRSTGERLKDSISSWVNGDDK